MKTGIILAFTLVSCIYMVQTASIGNSNAIPEGFENAENLENNVGVFGDLDTAETAGGFGRGGGGFGGGYGGYGGGYGGYGGGGRRGYGGGGFGRGGGGYGGGGYGRYG